MKLRAAALPKSINGSKWRGRTVAGCHARHAGCGKRREHDMPAVAQHVLEDEYHDIVAENAVEARDSGRLSGYRRR